MENLVSKPDKKKEIIDKYNKTSHFYDDRYFLIQSEKFNIALKNFRLKNKVILDAGCGTGLLLNYILKSKGRKDNLRYFYVAIDISEKMLDIFKEKIKQIYEKNLFINLMLADLENLPIRDHIFHEILSFTSFQNLPSILKGIKESFRVAKNNANIKFSILKKKINEKHIISILREKLECFKTINIKNVEDIIFLGKLHKK
ncbi:MAG: class I SAM-dependent methyltransferase [Promethearchaeota archaeon]